MIKRFKSNSNPKGVGQKSNTSKYNSMRYANPKNYTYGIKLEYIHVAMQFKIVRL